MFSKHQNQLGNTPFLLFSIFLFCSSLAIWQYQIPPFNFISLKLNDLNFSLNQKQPHPDIVFVAIDEKSVNKLGRWPWDRKTQAMILDKLSPAKIIGLDIVFSEASNQEADTLLATAINSNNTICSFFFRNESTQTMNDDIRWLMSDSALERIRLSNTPQLSGKYIETNIMQIMESCTASAAISTVLDKDTLVRKYPLTLYFDGENFPSLGTQILRHHLNQELFIDDDTGVTRASIGNNPVPVDTLNLSYLNYYAMENYRIISAVDLLHDNSDIKNKIVIFGISEAGLTDVRSTPIGNIPGPLIHYTFISNILDNTLLTIPEILNHLLFVFFFLLPLLLPLIAKQVVTRATCYFLISLIFIIITKTAYAYNHILIESFYPLFALSLMSIFQELRLYQFSEKENKLISTAFESYVSPEILRQLKNNKEELSLGGVEKEISVLFCDIRNFTNISENMASTELVNLLNKHFEPLTKEIISNQGMLDKYIGDAVMAIFNAPIELSNHQAIACKVALNMLHIVNNNKDTNDKIKVGIGICSGPAVIGNMGSSLRFNYTAVGDTVNIASRLEGLCKTYAAPIIVSESTIATLDASFLYRYLDQVNVKGKDQALNIYELMENTDKNQKLKQLFDVAIIEMKNGNIEKGKNLLQQCENEFDDQVSSAILKIQFDTHS